MHLPKNVPHAECVGDAAAPSKKNMKLFFNFLLQIEFSPQAMMRMTIRFFSNAAVKGCNNKFSLL